MIFKNITFFRLLRRRSDPSIRLMRRSGEEANAAVADDDDNGNQDEVNV